MKVFWSEELDFPCYFTINGEELTQILTFQQIFNKHKILIHGTNSAVSDLLWGLGLFSG